MRSGHRKIWKKPRHRERERESKKFRAVRGYRISIKLKAKEKKQTCKLVQRPGASTLVIFIEENKYVYYVTKSNHN